MAKTVTDVPTLELDPFSDVFLSDPYQFHAQLRDAGQVVWLEPIKCFGLARHEEVIRALQDHAAFCSGRGVGLADFEKEAPWRPPSLLLEADPPLHDRARQVMNQVISPRTLKEVRAQWTKHAEALADELAERIVFDGVGDLAEVYPMRVFPDAVGVPQAGRAQLLVYAAAVFNAFGPRNAIFAAGENAALSAAQWVAEACKRENLAPGSWGAAVHAEAQTQGFDEQDAERLVRSLLSAGLDTTVNGLGHLMLALAQYPEQWRRLRENPALIKRAFDESLRWDSSVQTFFRTTTRDVEIGSAFIPGGSKVLLFLGAANRDPRKWESPEEFDVTRYTSGHVAFGFGIHQCVGQMVARLEAELVLTALLRRVKTLTLTGPPTRRLNNTLHALASAPMEVELG